MYHCSVNHCSGSFRAYESLQTTLLSKTLNLQVLFDCCQKAFLLSFGFKKCMKSEKTVSLIFLMDELINGVMQSVVDKQVHYGSYRFHPEAFGAIQLRFYHELPRMKVILTDNATTCNYSQKSVLISFGLQKTWNKSFERNMFG